MCIMDKEAYGFDDDIIELGNEPSDFSKVTELLLNEEYARRKTNLHKQEITVLATLDSVAQLYGIEFLLNWIPNYCEYKTSEKGEARQQITDIAKASIEREEQRFNSMRELMGNR